MCSPWDDDSAAAPTVETHHTKATVRREVATPEVIEREVRQTLANRISGTLMGSWLLVPELLRLGAWDLLCRWSGRPGAEISPRLGLQVVTEAALCATGLREQRCLTQKGYELVNGLPFVATDAHIHGLLNEHSVQEGKDLQVALGRIRHASGHYRGELLAIDPHRMSSFSQRQMTQLKPKPQLPAAKTLQSDFCLDAITGQPLCATLGSSSRTVCSSTVELLDMAGAILPRGQVKPLALADSEHVTTALFQWACANPWVDLLMPMPQQRYYERLYKDLAPDAFSRHWAGYATARVPFRFQSCPLPLSVIVQRSGEGSSSMLYRNFLTSASAERSDVELLAANFPHRWHIEEFFNLYQAMGWKRAGTLNLNIRYNRISLALIAQAACFQLRKRLGPPFNSWQAEHLASDLLHGIDGDLHVHDDRIIVTYYNAPDSQRLRQLYEDLPNTLAHEHVDPRIPWLYNFQLDFRFR